MIWSIDIRYRTTTLKIKLFQPLFFIRFSSMFVAPTNISLNALVQTKKQVEISQTWHLIFMSLKWLLREATLYGRNLHVSEFPSQSRKSRLYLLTSPAALLKDDTQRILRFNLIIEHMLLSFRKSNISFFILLRSQ